MSKRLKKIGILKCALLSIPAGLTMIACWGAYVYMMTDKLLFPILDENVPRYILKPACNKTLRLQKKFLPSGETKRATLETCREEKTQ